MDSSSIAEPAERPYVSTGHLPIPETVQKLVCDAHQRFKSNTDGAKFTSPSSACQDSGRVVRRLRHRHQVERRKKAPALSAPTAARRCFRRSQSRRIL